MSEASKKKSNWCNWLARVNLSEISKLLSQVKPILFQQRVANWHVKKRWSNVSSAPYSQSTQRSSSWTWIWRRVSIVFVLSRSTMISQAKNLTLAVHLDFQMTLKIGCTSKKLHMIVELFWGEDTTARRHPRIRLILIEMDLTDD